MIEKPLISIITVNLNDVKGLGRTLKSVFEQTWQEFEFIVIDGGSSDGSKDLIESHNERIDRWVSEPDSGIYNAMNKGIKMARGKYVYFLNSGDWLYDENVLIKVSEHLFNYDVIYGNLVKFYSEITVIDKGPESNSVSLYTFFKYNLNHQATFIKRSLFEKYGRYDEKLNIVSDWKFFLIALGLNDSQVKYIDENIACYPMNGISSNLTKRDLEKERVKKELISEPITRDLDELHMLKQMNSQRIEEFRQLEKSKIGKKLNSLSFKFFKFFRKIKPLS